MPRPPTLKIHEIFSSLQGEGLRQGEPTLFIRLSGCNLRCGFCDTKEAWEGGRDMTIPEILEEARKAHAEWPAGWVCLTGGEPLLQDLGELTAGLKAEGRQLQVETNGTLFQDLPIDWWTVSPKPPDYLIHSHLIDRAREVKLVITESVSYAHLISIRKQAPASIPLLVQPESNRTDLFKKACDYLNTASLEHHKNIRLSIQMHKIFGIK